MKIFEITAGELKQGKATWKDAAFQDAYRASSIRGDIKQALPDFQKLPRPERDKRWPVKIWNSLSKKEQDHLLRHSSDRYGDEDIHSTLEKVISKSEPVPNNVLSYRGLILDKKKVNAILAKLDKGQTVQLKNKHPTSFTDEANSAWAFATSSKRTVRIPNFHKKELVPILLEVLIPAGTKLARIAMHHGIGNEHVTASNTKIEIVKYKKYRAGFKLSGYLK